MARWRESRARAPAITRAPETRDLSRIDRGSGIYKFRCGKKDSTLSRACVQSSTSLSLSLRKLKRGDTTGVGVHTWTNRHTDGRVLYVTFHYLGRCLALLLYAIRYVSTRARIRVCVFFGSVNVVNYISRSSLACKHRAR